MILQHAKGRCNADKIRECSIKGEKHIALIFPYGIDTIALIKEIEGRKWSALKNSGIYWSMGQT